MTCLLVLEVEETSFALVNESSFVMVVMVVVEELALLVPTVVEETSLVPVEVATSLVVGAAVVSLVLEMKEVL